MTQWRFVLEPNIIYIAWSLERRCFFDKSRIQLQVTTREKMFRNVTGSLGCKPLGPVITWLSRSLINCLGYFGISLFVSTDLSSYILASTVSGERYPSCWIPMWRTAGTLSSAQQLKPLSDMLFPAWDLANTRHRTKACRW